MDRYLEQAWQALHSVTGGLAPAALAASRTGKWSVAEVVEHLGLTYDSTARALEKLVAGGRPRASAPKMRDRLAQFVVITLGHLPTGRQAPEFTRPRGSMQPERVVEYARDGMQRMDAALAKAEMLWGTRKRIADHPILGPLSVAQWRRFHWVHTRHHARQLGWK